MPSASLPAFQGTFHFAKPNSSAKRSGRPYIPTALCSPIIESVRLGHFILVICVNFFLAVQGVKTVDTVSYLDMSHKTAKLIQEALSACHVPSAVLGAGDTAVKNRAPSDGTHDSEKTNSRQMHEKLCVSGGNMYNQVISGLKGDRNREKREPKRDEGTSHLESEMMRFWKREQQRRALKLACVSSIREQQDSRLEGSGRTQSGRTDRSDHVHTCMRHSVNACELNLLN